MAISIFPIPATLPTNAAAETGGNLALLTRLVDLQQLQIGLLNAVNLQLANITGQSVSVGDCLDENVLGSIQ